mmetsp:Transcript_2132/g.4831  ORF Transcript_2132/g.4831 Transcript_2132/m.4831 type:complete len:226 (-) Transcript_2132:138-815(-)
MRASPIELLVYGFDAVTQLLAYRPIDVGIGSLAHETTCTRHTYCPAPGIEPLLYAAGRAAHADHTRGWVHTQSVHEVEHQPRLGGLWGGLSGRQKGVRQETLAEILCSELETLKGLFVAVSNDGDLQPSLLEALQRLCGVLYRFGCPHSLHVLTVKGLYERWHHPGRGSDVRQCKISGPLSRLAHTIFCLLTKVPQQSHLACGVHWVRVSLHKARFILTQLNASR